jgi:DNA-binding XRE family transcriptional regulator
MAARHECLDCERASIDNHDFTCTKGPNCMERRQTATPHANPLLAWRLRLGIKSRADAARRLGLSRNTYAAYEEGRAEIPLYISLACAALAYGLPPL